MTEREEIIAAVDRINEELYNKAVKKDKIMETLPQLGYVFYPSVNLISLSIPGEYDAHEFNLYCSENHDRKYYEKSDKYETFYSFIKRRWRDIKKNLDKIVI